MLVTVISLGLALAAPDAPLAQVSGWPGPPPLVQVPGVQRLPPIGQAPPVHAQAAPTGLASTFRQGMCLDVRGGANDTILWPCHGRSNQQFAFLSGGSGHLGVMGRCLGAAGGEGTSLVVEPCRNTPAQRWTLHWNGALANEQGWCADVAGRGGQGARVIAFRCTNADNQRWRMAPFDRVR